MSTATAQAVVRPTRALRFANLGHYYNHVIMLLYPTVVLALEGLFDLSYGDLLSLAFPGFVLFGIAALPAGWLADRWSTRGMMMIYFFGTGAATALTGFARDPFELGAGLAVIGLFASIYHPVGTSFIVRHAVNRAAALGANGVCGTLGVATAAVIAGALTQGLGWRAAFFAPGVLCFVTGIAFVLLTSRADDGPREAKAAHADPPVARRDAVRGLAILGVTVLCVGLIAQAFLVGLPKVFAVRISLIGAEGLLGTTTLVTLALLIGASGQLVGGYLAGRFPFKMVYIGMYAVMVPVALASAWAVDGPLIVLGAALMLLMTASLPAENCLVAGFCPADWHARAYGAKFVLALGISSIAVPTVGLVYDRTGGFLWFYLGLGLLALIVAAFAIFLPALRAAPAE
jgi:MFS family permease